MKVVFLYNTLLCSEADARVFQSLVAEVADVLKQSPKGGLDISSLVNKPPSWCVATDLKPDTHETQNANVLH